MRGRRGRRRRKRTVDLTENAWTKGDTSRMPLDVRWACFERGIDEDFLEMQMKGETFRR